MDVHSFAAQMRAWGNRITPTLLDECQALYAPHHEAEPYQGVHVVRDQAYGAHERQRLDLFRPQGATGALPTLVFVHGGGFVGGDKKRPGTPYHDNVALWAVRHGMVGVNITYRVAPSHPWPAGAEDVAGALHWLRAGAAAHGIDPARLFVMGTSAGATHVASYVASEHLHVAENAGIAGAILLSGLYDIQTTEANGLLRAYFGKDPALYGERSSLRGLVESRVPLMFGLAEHDPADFEAQALQLVNAWRDRHQRWPRLARLLGHNHFTATLHLNTPDDSLGRPLVDFMEEVR